MKTLFTFLLSGLVAVSAMAADVAGRITVSFSGNKEYRISIDGRTYYSDDNRLYLNNVRPGRHQIEVYKLRKNNTKKDQRVYSGSFTVRPQYDMHILVNRHGRVEFDERRNGQNSRDRDDRNWDRQDRDWNDRNDRRDDRGWDRRNEGGWDNNYRRAMSETEFSEFLQKVRSQWFGKMNTAKDGIGRNYFTTQQVRQVLQVFSSESDRLELAKLAYSKVVDQRNFTQLYDLFSRQGQAELDQYTRSARY